MKENVQEADCKGEQGGEERRWKDRHFLSDKIVKSGGFEAWLSEAAVLWYEKAAACLSLNTVGQKLSIFSILYC